MPKKKPEGREGQERKVTVILHPTGDEELEQMDAEDRAHVYEFIARINGKPHAEVVSQLVPRTEPKVFQKERSARRGTLRILFYWGEVGTLWFIGAFVKNNDRQGERLAARILKRGDDVEALQRNKGNKQ